MHSIQTAAHLRTEGRSAPTGRVRAMHFKHLAVMLAIALGTAGCDQPSRQSLLASGKQLSAEGNPKAAILQFRSALQQDPQDAEARILLGQALLADGDATAAVNELKKALEANASNAAVLPDLTRALLMTGEFNRVALAFDDVAIDDRQAMAAIKVNVATAWAALNNLEQSQAAIASALTAIPDHAPAQLLRARLLAATGKPDEAEALVEHVIAANDKLADAWQLRGELAAARAEPQKAEQYFHKAIQLDKRLVAAHGAIIAARLSANDLAGAKAQADALHQASPNHPLSALVDAQLAYAAGDLTRARDLAQRLVQHLPNHPSALVLAGNIEADLGSWVQAQAHFSKVLRINPGLVIARRNLARVEMQLGQYAKAMETLKPLLQAASTRADVLALAGEAEMRLDNFEASQRYFVRAAAQEPSNDRLRIAAAVVRIGGGDAAAGFSELERLSSRTTETYADLADYVARMQRSDYPGAQQALNRMEAKAPHSAAPMELRGQLELARNKLPAARAAFEQAAKADPQRFSAVQSLADIDQLEGRPDLALRRMQAAVDANPKNAQALMALAEFQVKTDAPTDEVKKVLIQAIALAPGSSGLRLQLIELLQRKRLVKEALAAAKDASAEIPDDPILLEALGRSQAKAGELEQSLTTYRRLTTIAPRSASAYLALSGLYLKLGDRLQAEAAVKQALDVEPGSPSAQAALLDLLMSSDRSAEVLNSIRKFKGMRPNQPVHYLMEATFHIQRKDYDAAAAAYREGIQKTESSELAVALYGLMMQSGRTADAEQWAAQWLKKHSQDMLMEYQVALTAIARRDFASGEARLRGIVAVQPKNPLALNNLAWVIASRGKAGGVAYARRALALMPDDPATLDTLALALAAESHLPEALAVQRRALSLAPGDGGLRLGLAKLTLQAGDKATAKAELKALRELGDAFPAQAEVNRLLQGL